MNTRKCGDEIRIIAIDQRGKREEITDLYWFEEEGVHDFNGRGAHYDYSFEIHIGESDIIFINNKSRVIDVTHL